MEETIDTLLAFVEVNKEKIDVHIDVKGIENLDEKKLFNLITHLEITKNKLLHVNQEYWHKATLI
jgi:hypothetical protein